ncbi:hypothetical protein EBO15_10365 [Actinomadura harenae]|uniref:Uncharacterized protein n=1 Tax=Actinomadura harenae TaxID=2483351 RepID=A0A3M2M6Y9_9ACTN|nr:hypothetical protein EBO15_10365 [Actinomadura harenae]
MPTVARLLSTALDGPEELMRSVALVDRPHSPPVVRQLIGLMAVLSPIEKPVIAQERVPLVKQLWELTLSVDPAHARRLDELVMELPGPTRWQLLWELTGTDARGLLPTVGRRFNVALGWLASFTDDSDGAHPHLVTSAAILAPGMGAWYDLLQRRALAFAERFPAEMVEDTLAWWLVLIASLGVEPIGFPLEHDGTPTGVWDLNAALEAGAEHQPASVADAIPDETGTSPITRRSAARILHACQQISAQGRDDALGVARTQVTGLTALERAVMMWNMAVTLSSALPRG